MLDKKYIDKVTNLAIDIYMTTDYSIIKSLDIAKERLSSLRVAAHNKDNNHSKENINILAEKKGFENGNSKMD